MGHGTTASSKETLDLLCETDFNEVCVSQTHNSSNNFPRYPAGFVYIYSILYYITGQGSHIVLAQAIFALLYLSNLAVVMRLYSSVAMVSL